MTAFRASFSDVKLVKTRGVAQFVFELPIEEFDSAYQILGGVPIPGKERWVGIAVIKSPQQEEERAEPRQSPPPGLPTGGAKREWRDLPPSQQAGIRCDEPTFAAFLREERADDWHEAPDAIECVRLICGVASRSELNSNHPARVIWHQLSGQYEAWLALERAS